MTQIGFTYWQDGKDWLGYLDEFPDYLTQGESLSDLQSHLVDLQRELLSGAIPCVRRHAQLVTA
jgi:predicted RNase H-like HicB family nuclease